REALPMDFSSPSSLVDKRAHDGRHAVPVGLLGRKLPPSTAGDGVEPLSVRRCARSVSVFPRGQQSNTPLEPYPRSIGAPALSTRPRTLPPLAGRGSIRTSLPAGLVQHLPASSR